MQIGVYVWTYVCVCSYLRHRCVGACVFVHLAGIHAYEHGTLQHPTGCREPRQRVAGVQHHRFLLTDSKAMLSPGQASLLGLASSRKSLLRDKAKGQGISPPGSNSKEQDGREGWGSTSSSGELCITMHHLCPFCITG